MLRKGRQFLFHTWYPSCYSCYKLGDKSWIRKGPDCDSDKQYISVVICEKMFPLWAVAFYILVKFTYIIHYMKKMNLSFIDDMLYIYIQLLHFKAGQLFMKTFTQTQKLYIIQLIMINGSIFSLLKHGILTIGRNLRYFGHLEWK